MFSEPVPSLYHNTAGDLVTCPKIRMLRDYTLQTEKRSFPLFFFLFCLTSCQASLTMFLWCVLSSDISREFSGFFSEVQVTSWLVLQPEHNAVSAVMWLPAGLLLCHWQPCWSLECCQCRQHFAILKPSIWMPHWIFSANFLVFSKKLSVVPICNTVCS